MFKVIFKLQCGSPEPDERESCQKISGATFSLKVKGIYIFPNLTTFVNNLTIGEFSYDFSILKNNSDGKSVVFCFSL